VGLGTQVGSTLLVGGDRHWQADPLKIGSVDGLALTTELEKEGSTVVPSAFISLVFPLSVVSAK